MRAHLRSKFRGLNALPGTRHSLTVSVKGRFCGEC